MAKPILPLSERFLNGDSFPSLRLCASAFQFPFTFLGLEQFRKCRSRWEDSEFQVPSSKFCPARRFAISQGASRFATRLRRAELESQNSELGTRNAATLLLEPLWDHSHCRKPASAMREGSRVGKKRVGKNMQFMFLPPVFLSKSPVLSRSCHRGGIRHLRALLARATTPTRISHRWARQERRRAK